MDNLTNNLIKSVPVLLGNYLIYLKNRSLPNLSGLFGQELKESFDFLTTLNNISVLDECLSQGASLQGPAEAERNLLACVNSGEAQILFFNISGSEFFHFYVCGSLAGARALLQRVWNKALLYIDYFSRRIIGDKPELEDGAEILKADTKA